MSCKMAFSIYWMLLLAYGCIQFADTNDSRRCEDDSREGSGESTTPKSTSSISATDTENPFEYPYSPDTPKYITTISAAKTQKNHFEYSYPFTDTSESIATDSADPYGYSFSPNDDECKDVGKLIMVKSSEVLVFLFEVPRRCVQFSHTQKGQSGNGGHLKKTTMRSIFSVTFHPI